MLESRKKEMKRKKGISKRKNIEFKKRLNHLGFGSYSAYLRSPHWQSVKERMRKSKLPNECGVCGLTGRLELHHKTYKSLGNENLNHLIYLCPDHHEETHKLLKSSSCSLWKANKKIKEVLRKSL